MTLTTGQRRPHFKNVLPKDPAVKPFGEWPDANRRFYADFRAWLRECGYGPSSVNTYGVAARMALGWLQRPYGQIDPDADLARVRTYLAARFATTGTASDYAPGLLKLAQYLRLRCHKPVPPKGANWALYLRELPSWLADDVRAYVLYRARKVPADRQVQACTDHLRRLTVSLRWIQSRSPLNELADIRPEQWLAYLDNRLAEAITPTTLNHELQELQDWLRFWQEQGQPICARLLLVEKLREADGLPKDVPVAQLRELLAEIERATKDERAHHRRTALMDHAWFLLMLHSGLRTLEVRRLKPGDIDWHRRLVRIEQSKGLRDRIVPLSRPTLAALRGYLAVRGPAEALPEQVFTYRHRPLANYYCYHRLHTYGKRCGVCIHPHQLRHSCATLLLNAGTPILAVQAILGHTHIETTLEYARLYDGTIAADYYQAMAQVEGRFALPEDQLAEPPSYGQLLALLDGLRRGTLSRPQAETVQTLRAGLAALAEREIAAILAGKPPESAPDRTNVRKKPKSLVMI